MSKFVFRSVLVLCAAVFSVYFAVSVIPALIESGDVVGAALAGFVNPFSAGYATDVILCWVVLAAWVVYESSARQVRFGWVCLLIGVVPGVVVGLSAYLLLRAYQLEERGA